MSELWLADSWLPRSCAGAFCAAVKTHRTLRVLDMGGNVSIFSRGGGLLFGQAIESNQGLKELNVSHCLLRADSIEVLCEAAIVHPTLQTLQLDGNPIDGLGAISVWRVAAESKVAVSMRKCRLMTQGPFALINALWPLGGGVVHFKCLLSNAVGRCRVSRLLRYARLQQRGGIKELLLDNDPVRLSRVFTEEGPVPESSEALWVPPFSGYAQVTFVPHLRPLAAPARPGAIPEIVESILCSDGVSDGPSLVACLSTLAAVIPVESAHVPVLLKPMVSPEDLCSVLFAAATTMPDLESGLPKLLKSLRGDVMIYLEPLLGGLLSFCPGNPSGRYELDLSIPGDRVVWQRLVRESNGCVVEGLQHGYGDTGQSGFRSCIRNVFCAGKGRELMAQPGSWWPEDDAKVTLDFAATSRPQKTELPLKAISVSELERDLRDSQDSGEAAAASLHLLRKAVSGQWLSASHICRLVAAVEDGSRVDAAVSLVGRCYDLGPLCRLLLVGDGNVGPTLSHEESWELMTRFGVLNLWCPLFPDGVYFL